MAEFNVEPYYDDFEASNGAKEKNYMRILFRPDRAVQGRELTQIQSIIQNQIKNFGDHIFKDGSPVYGGHITLDNGVSYIKLKTSYNNNDIDLADFDNLVISNVSGVAKIRAKVTATDESQTQPTLMVRYLRGTTFPNSNVITTSLGTVAQLVDTDSTGTGSVASIASGVFYVDGYFVQVEPQTIVLDAYSSTPTYKVGLEIDENVIDYSADANLLDPAQDSFNYQATGADRYQFRLNLAKRKLDNIDDSKFFELLRVENGLVTKQVNYPIYSEIENLLARRTFDESGDYTVRPFGVSLSANSACSDVFVVNVEPGKAYVKGFEYETFGTQKLQVNKARSTNTSSDYDLSMEYGNYLIANNFIGSSNGMFDISKLNQLELHCVPRANINTTSTTGYNTTYMGTVRVRNFDRYSPTEYYVYMTDMQLSPNTVTASATSVNGNSIVFPTAYSNLTNAYANVAVRVLSGTSLGDVRTITSYDGATKTAFVNLNFSANISSGDTLSLSYGAKDIDSLVQAISTKTSLNVAMDVSSSSRDITNSTIITDVNKNSLIFPLPENFIANGSISGADFIHRKFFENRTFTSNGDISLGLSGNETYNYGSDGSFLSSAAANANIIVVVKNKLTSNATNGTIFNLTAAGSGVRRDTSTQLTIFTGANNIFTGDIFATVKVNNSEVTNLRTKLVVRGNTANTTLRTTDSPTNGTAVIGSSTVKIDAANGFVWFTDTSIINKTPTGNNSLYVPDVFKVIKVFDSGNASYPPNTINAIDITSRFFLDSGQTKNYYDHSKLVLKSGYSAPKGQMVALVQYYEHTGTQGYFTVSSYPPAQYANNAIPVFVDSDGMQYNLRDVIDFRPTRDIGTSSNVQSYTFVGMKTPTGKSNDPMELTYSYYVPRIDKIILTKDRELKTLTGVASKYPLEPKDTENAMTLFRLDIPAYTANPTDVDITKVENRRYTMRDIGNLETRIKNIEYYTALSISEKKATDTTILYEDNATPKEKYGIVADNFTGFNIADTTSPDFVCSLEKGRMAAYARMTQIPMVVSSVGAGAQLNGKTASVGYTEQTIIAQTAATSNVSVQPYLYGVFDGSMRLSPDGDSWFSTNLAPISISPLQSVPTLSSTSSVVSSLQPIDDATIQGWITASGAFGFVPISSSIDDWFVSQVNLGLFGTNFHIF